MKKGPIKFKLFVDGKEVETLTEEHRKKVAENFSRVFSEFYSRPENLEEYKQLPTVG